MAGCYHLEITLTDIDEEFPAPSDAYSLADYKALNVMASCVCGRLPTRSVIHVRRFDLTALAVRGDRLGSGVDDLPPYGAVAQARASEGMVDDRAAFRDRTIVAVDGEPLAFPGFDLCVNLDSEALRLHDVGKALAPVHRQGALSWKIDTRGKGERRLG